MGDRKIEVTLLTHEMLNVRDELSVYWHDEAANWTKLPFSGFGSDDRWSAFCVAKDWLQDTGESLLVHYNRGFTDDPYLGYIELLGLLQAVYVQQDAIAEMHFAITGSVIRADEIGMAGWKNIRDFRNRTCGHPTRQGRRQEPICKTVTNRQRMSYQQIDITIELNTVRSYASVNLEVMLAEYDGEASVVLQNLFSKLRLLMESQRPN